MDALVSYVAQEVGRGAPAEVMLPQSKSISNRLLILNSIAGGKPLHRQVVAECDDTEAMLNALDSGNVGHINIGAAGTAMRFLTAYYAALPGSDIVLDGSERMRQRPISLLVDALRLIGAEIEYQHEEGFPPLHILGRRLEGGCIELDAGVSSQYTSALLMISPVTTLGLELTLKGKVVSLPYIQMTLEMMKSFGVDHLETHPDESEFSIKIEPCSYKVPVIPYKVEGDWSGASYWYEIAALTGQSFKLKHLQQYSLQGDSCIVELFSRLGIESEQERDGILIKPAVYSYSTDLYKANLVKSPDLAQTVIATCCGIGRPFYITGLETLRIKETDRLSAMKSELQRLGYNVKIVGDDTMEWDGTYLSVDVDTPLIATYKDHRMAMALAPLASKLSRLRIENSTVVSKSYPDYWEHLSMAGFKVDFV